MSAVEGKGLEMTKIQNAAEIAIARQFAIAQAGGACALCGKRCGAGSYCCGCSAFVCLTHGEPGHVPGKQESSTKAFTPHAPSDHGGGHG